MLDVGRLEGYVHIVEDNRQGVIIFGFIELLLIFKAYLCGQTEERHGHQYEDKILSTQFLILLIAIYMPVV
jgi:hypothetical protein